MRLEILNFMAQVRGPTMLCSFIDKSMPPVGTLLKPLQFMQNWRAQPLLRLLSTFQLTPGNSSIYLSHPLFINENTKERHNLGETDSTYLSEMAGKTALENLQSWAAVRKIWETTLTFKDGGKTHQAIQISRNSCNGGRTQINKY